MILAVQIIGTCYNCSQFDLQPHSIIVTSACGPHPLPALGDVGAGFVAELVPPVPLLHVVQVLPDVIHHGHTHRIRLGQKSRHVLLTAHYTIIKGYHMS